MASIFRVSYVFYLCRIQSNDNTDSIKYTICLKDSTESPLPLTENIGKVQLGSAGWLN